MPSIELKSISGKGIKSLQLFQKPSLYVVISFTNEKNNKRKTAIDRSNGENPDWDQPMKIDIDGNVQDLILQFDVKADALLGDRVVGRAFIPMTDLDFCGAVQHVSYQLKTPEGKPNGVLNFSYKFVGFAPAKESVPSPPMTEQLSFYPPPATPNQAVLYPQPSAASSFYPTVEPVAAVYPPPAEAAYPPPARRPLDHGFSFHRPMMDVGGYYPHPPEMAHGVYPPPQEPECCYRSIPQPAAGWYPSVPQQEPDCCYRSIPQPAAGWYPSVPQQEPDCCYRSIPQPEAGWYPSAPQPAPGFYPAVPQAPEEYGYRQRGLYGYN